MTNPFRPTRFEWHNKPLIWVSPLARKILDQEGPVYIAGARGSGKTSILKALETLEQVSNETLASQIKLSGMGALGIYFRACDVFTQSKSGIEWQNLAPRTADPILLETGFISALFEQTAIRVLAEVLCVLRRKRRIRYGRIEAQQAINRITGRKFKQLLEEFDGLGDPLLSLAAALNRRIDLAYLALLRGDRAAFQSAIDLGQPGSWLQKAAPELLALAGPPLFASKALRLKICVDECDFLVASQQTILNSLVRRSSNPIEWTLAYVDTMYNSTNTIFPNQNLTESDRKVVPLDESTKPHEMAEFRERCQAIVSYRLFYNLPPEKQRQLRRAGSIGDIPIDKLFELRKRMPDNDINDLLHYVISARSSVSREARLFSEKAHQFRQKLLEIGKAGRPQSEFVREILGHQKSPYYQTILAEKLGLHIEDYSRNAEKRESLAATLRRKSVAAMLFLLKELDIREIPYAGHLIMLQLADGCIRDFLELMASTYEEWRQVARSKDLWTFVNNADEIPIEIQRKGILRSSQEKFDGIKQANLAGVGAISGDSAFIFSRLISALGKLTKKLQVSEKGDLSLHTAERGVFLVSPTGMAKIEERAGYPAGTTIGILKRLDSESLTVASDRRIGAPKFRKESSIYRFRLHKRFAPWFGFSYRGGLEEVRLPDRSVVDLVFAKNEFSENAWLDQVLLKLGGSQDQIDLFLND